MSAVHDDGNNILTNNNNIEDRSPKKRIHRKRVPVPVKKEAQQDVMMSGPTGYTKSWWVIQKAVDSLMTEIIIPVPQSTIKYREPRHLPKRRVCISLYRDVHLNNLILKSQKFQMEYEQQGNAFTRQVIIDYPIERQRPRKERHYDFWPYFEHLPNLDEEEHIAPEDIEEEEVHDTLGFASNSSIELAEECKENSQFLPAPLSEEITKEIAGLFAPKKSKLSTSFVEKYMKKGPFSKIF